jgi:glutamate-1-semialdehyde 2,1-aminomutase
MSRTSAVLFEQAKRYIPGGVNSPVRAFGSVGADPYFVARAKGSRVYDVDGREYIEYVASWGPLILGHSHPKVLAAIEEAMGKGTTYGAPTELEVEMARLIVEAFPAMDMVRMVSSGTEAAMSAIRLARGFTGRELIAKFEGCYHGHADSLLVKAGSGVATLGLPGCAGVPRRLAELTIALPYNDIETFETAMERYGDEMACVILEPVAGNMGVVPPAPGFLETIRELTRRKGTLLIFDEVITGFRLTWGGWQNLAGIEPDLTCLGKIIGGGLPAAAFGGRREIMECLAPLGPVYQAGTLSGNPLALSAGLAVLKLLRDNGKIYESLEEKTARLCRGIGELFVRKGMPMSINQVGSMFTPFFSGEIVKDLTTAQKSDTARFARFFREMLARGISLPPSQFEACFVSLAHSEEDLERTIEACGKTLDTL